MVLWCSDTHITTVGIEGNGVSNSTLTVFHTFIDGYDTLSVPCCILLYHIAREILCSNCHPIRKFIICKSTLFASIF